MLKPRIGLALGGGGARGAAHLGVLRHLEQVGLRPHCLAGTSAGAIVAALWAFGVPLEKAAQEMRQLRPVDLTGLRFKGLGLFENKEVAQLLASLLPADARIEQAPLPLAFKATDLLTGRGVVLKEGPVIPAVLASCCVPGVYLAEEIEGRLLVDGGLTENVPLSALRALGAHFLIGVNLNGHSGYQRPKGVVDVLSNALDIAIDAQTRRQLEAAHIVVSMDLSRFSRTSSEDFDALVAEGQRATQAKIRNLTALSFWLRVKRLWRFLRALAPVRVPEILGPSEGSDVK